MSRGRRRTSQRRAYPRSKPYKIKRHRAADPAHRQVEAPGALRRDVKTPIMLDESLCSRVDAERAIEAQSCDLFNLRLSKCGGFIPTLRLAQLARQHNLGYQLGCQIGETALLSAAGRHFAGTVTGSCAGPKAPTIKHLSMKPLGDSATSPSAGAAGRKRCRGRASASPSIRRPSSASRGARRCCLADAYTIEEFAASDGYRWKYRVYPAQDAPRAELVFIHGIQSHAGWYEHSCMRFSQAGYRVSFLDRRGAGMNRDARGDAPGGFRRLLDDLAEFLTALPRTTPRGHSVARLPVFLGAISWGGKLAVALERRHPGLVDGLILLCPGFYAKVRPMPLGQRIGIIFSRLFRSSAKNIRSRSTNPTSSPPCRTGSSSCATTPCVSIRPPPACSSKAFASTATCVSVREVRPRPGIRCCCSPPRGTASSATTGRGIMSRNSRAPDKADHRVRRAAHHTLEFEPEPSSFCWRCTQGWLDRHLAVLGG